MAATPSLCGCYAFAILHMRSILKACLTRQWPAGSLLESYDSQMWKVVWYMQAGRGALQCGLPHSHKAEWAVLWPVHVC